MLLYNYYTSSVVSWLLNAAPPTIANIDGLIHSNLEVVFEDIGYTRSWLEVWCYYLFLLCKFYYNNVIICSVSIWCAWIIFLQLPGFYYYSGFPRLKEDELRKKKVTKAKKTVNLLQSVDNGIALVRKGGTSIF